MRRRDFILGIAGMAGTWSLAGRAQAQTNRKRHVAVLRYANKNDPGEQALEAVFTEQLEKLGWRDADNVEIETLWATDAQSLSRDAAQVVAAGPDVIVANAAAARAVSDVTRDRPIVFININDPVGLGLVDDLAHPGGNITGFYNYDFGMIGKWLEMLKEIAPNVKSVALLGSREIPSYEGWVHRAKEFAQSFGVAIMPLELRTAGDLPQALENVAQTRGSALLVLPGSLVARQRDVIISGAKRLRLPAIYPLTFYAKAGGLLSYGIDVADIYRRAAAYVDRILKGANPGELPVQGPSKFELVINMKTASELGLEVPQQLRLLADQLIR